jgi:hypothetical protein
MDEKDIWRSAKMMIDSVGKDAEAAVAERVAKARKAGDTLNVEIWEKVADAVRQLRRQKPNASEPLN